MGWPEVDGVNEVNDVDELFRDCDMNLRHDRCAAINFGVWEY